MHIEALPKALGRRRHVFFDLDGTLIDSRPAIVSTYRHVFDSVLGRPFAAGTGERLRALLAMRPAEVFAEQTADSVDTCLKAYNAFYLAQGGHEVRPYDGARALLDRLRAIGRGVGIVTNKGQARARLDLRNTGLIDEKDLTVLIGAEKTVERKPHPAPLFAALEHSGAAAGDSIYVGDGPHDMEAAIRAGMACVGASYGYYAASALNGAGADALIAAPLDLLRLVEPTEQ